MLCNLFDAAWSNIIGNVGEAGHGKGRTGSEGVAATAPAAWRVEVTRTTVSLWDARLQAGGGLEALKRRPRGRRSGVEEAQRRELMQALKAGALGEGFPTDLWTLPRVGQLIERRFGRAYSESEVWRILVSLGFSCQRPSGRALERDEGRSSAGSRYAGRR